MACSRKRFYNSSVQKWLDENNTLIYYTHNEDNSIVAEKLIRTLKSKTYN